MNNLSGLTSLDVSGNAVRGTLVALPSTLTFLDVESNMLGGSPFNSELILALTNLQQLHISTNAFTGRIPTELGKLLKLEELWMANNRFEGSTIPTQLGNLQNLGTLRHG